jgi:hypothetical protein
VDVRRSQPALGIAALLTATPAFAETQAPALSPEAQVVVATTPPDGRTTQDRLETPGAEGADLAPPPRPHHRGLVLESTLGALGFLGEFRHVAPPAYWLHAQLGYELLDWLMFLGEGEVAFTDTGESQDESHARAFPIWGCGAGARGTFRLSGRVASFVQGQFGVLAADIAHNALTVLGFREAESLKSSFGLRVGVEWFQLDRHMALLAQIGIREAQGFGKLTTSDLPLMWDAGLGLNYTF